MSLELGQPQNANRKPMESKEPTPEKVNPKETPAPQNTEELLDKIRKQMHDHTYHLQYSYILSMLHAMAQGARRMEAELLSAVCEDLRLDGSEVYRMSLYPFFEQLKVTIKNLKKW